MRIIVHVVLRVIGIILLPIILVNLFFEDKPGAIIPGVGIIFALSITWAFSLIYLLIEAFVLNRKKLKGKCNANLLLCGILIFILLLFFSLFPK